MDIYVVLDLLDLIKWIIRELYIKKNIQNTKKLLLSN